MTWKSGFYSRQGRDIFSTAQIPDRIWGPSSLLSNGYRGLLTHDCVTDHTLPSNTEVKNVRKHTSTSPWIFLTLYLIKHKNNLTFAFTRVNHWSAILWDMTMAIIRLWRKIRHFVPLVEVCYLTPPSDQSELSWIMLTLWAPLASCILLGAKYKTAPGGHFTRLSWGCLCFYTYSRFSSVRTSDEPVHQPFLISYFIKGKSRYFSFVLWM
jgi:hypothetical protein